MSPTSRVGPAPARELLRDASLELARLRRIRGASHKTWRRIARAQARLALAVALLAAAIAEPAAAVDPLFRAFPAWLPALPGAELSWGMDPTFADIDGDGDLDVFVGGYSGNTRFFENTGTATQAALGPAQQNPFGLVDVGSRAELSFADLDGDGDLDALVGTRFTPQVHFFRNTGTATSPAFAAPLTNPFGLAALVTELADLDGDGDVDAFRPSSPGLPGFSLPSGMVFHRNTGSATAPAFAAGVVSPFGLAHFAQGFADLDGDGDLDGWNGDNGLLRFENTGSPTSPAFAAPVLDAVEIPARSRLDFADVDGDGDLDAVLAGYDGTLESYSSLWLENVGSAGAPVLTSAGNPFGLGSDVTFYDAGVTSSFADLDGDGDLDVLEESRFKKNVGSPTAPAFEPVPVLTLALAGEDPVLADLDGDGDPDAVVGLASGDLDFFENTGSASEPDFASPLPNPFGLANAGTWAAPAFGDLDGDGDLDALVGNAAGSLAFFENTGSAAVPAFAAAQATPFGLASTSGYASPTFVDLDGDGDLDAMVGDSSGAVLSFQNTGSASAPAFGAPATNPFGLAGFGTHASPEFADLDADGDLDAYVGRRFQSGFQQNTGTANAPAFAAPVNLLLGVAQSAPELADLDADGDLDAVIGKLDGTVSYFPNTGTPSTRRFVSPSDANPFGVVARDPDFADLDADGDLDLFSSANFEPMGTRLVGPNWYENTGGASTPGFGLLVTRPFGLPDIGGGRFVSADLDADGDLDALIANSVGGLDSNFVFVPNTGSADAPAFGAPATNPFGLSNVGSPLASPDVMDLDGDGDLDVLVGAIDGNLRLFRNTGSASTPAFAAPLVNPFGLSRAGSFASPEIADLDGDGDLDVLVGDAFGRSVFFENVVIDPDACRDGIDNDGDGGFDLAEDPGCADADDSSELSALECDNGVDDDADGLTDLSDPGCVHAGDASEFDPPSQSWGCGLGPELLLLAPLLAAARRRRD